MCRWYIKIIVCVLCMIYVVPSWSDTETEDYYKKWEFSHSDKYKLTWYYNTEKDFNANHPNRVSVGDKTFTMRPDVRPPTINGVYLLEYSKVNEGDDVLDVGTGSGIHSIFAAQKANHIVATDIYAPAIENAIANAKMHQVTDKIDFRVGDLLGPLRDDEKFDVVYFNINYPFSVDDKDRQRLHERFFSGIHRHLKPDARIYYQTSFIRNLPDIYEMLTRNGFRIMEMHMEYLLPSKHEPVFFMVREKIKNAD